MSEMTCPLCGREMTAIETYAGRGELHCGHCDLTIGGNEAKTPDELTALLEQRTCRIIEDEDTGYLTCSKCGAIQPDDYTVYHCWCCGRKIKED